MDTAREPFADVPRTARGHLGLLFYEAVYRLVVHIASRARASGKPARQVFEDFPFLSSYWDELRSRFPEADSPERTTDAMRNECERWEESVEEWLPLRAIRRELSLEHDALVCLVVTGLVEEDSNFGNLFSALQQPLGNRRPTLGLLQLLMQTKASGANAWNLCRPLLEAGFLAGPGQETPKTEWELRTPSAIWNALKGERHSEPLPGALRHSGCDFPRVSDLIVAETQRARLTELVALLECGQARTVVVRGMSGSPRLEIVGSLAREIGWELLEVSAGPQNSADVHQPLIGPLCTVTRSIPVFALDLGPGEIYQTPPLSGYRGPVGILAGREGGLSGPLVERSVTLSLEPETPEQRLGYWRRELIDHSDDELAAIAKTFTLSGGHIKRTATLAVAHAALSKRTKITASDVREAIRTISQQQLDSLAERLQDGGDWSQLVIPASTARELGDLEARCRNREQLAMLLGNDLPGGLNRGVRALFEGPSGTGKTLAARIMAGALGVDLYRVDLASVVNKYIGETEKNLSRVLSRAEDLDVILLLDEGDALMSRRTDVKSAHDRYANLETNYLLQRLETYTGIVIVTTNVSDAIDSAFRRRLDVIVKFHLPEPEERWRLWQVHLPSNHAIGPDELEEISLSYAMTGGQIRNAAVQSALVALGRSGGAVSAGDLRSAILVEYRKSGAALPAGNARNNDGRGHHLSGFLTAIL